LYRNLGTWGSFLERAADEQNDDDDNDQFH
jgi:hypothetical protein